MFSLQSIIVLSLCLIQVLLSSYDANMGLPQKNRNRTNDTGSTGLFVAGPDGHLVNRIIFWNGTFSGDNQTGVEYENVSLTCKVNGIPSASIHWLKNGKRIDQSGTCQSIEADIVDINAGRSEKLSIYSTNSVLYIDCLDETDQANYTCVAQTATQRETKSTFLTVVPSENPPEHILKACAEKGRPARIYMRTRIVLELENNTVRFFCRAQGNPTPTITWYDSYNETIQDGGNYSIAANGDLFITNITWVDHMGQYVCEANNVYGTDFAYIFLYPTRKNKQRAGHVIPSM